MRIRRESGRRRWSHPGHVGQLGGRAVTAGAQAAKPAVPRVYVWKRQGPRPHRRDLLTRAPEGAGGETARAC